VTVEYEISIPEEDGSAAYDLAAVEADLASPASDFTAALDAELDAVNLKVAYNAGVTSVAAPQVAVVGQSTSYDPVDNFGGRGQTSRAARDVRATSLSTILALGTFTLWNLRAD